MCFPARTESWSGPELRRRGSLDTDSCERAFELTIDAEAA